MLKSRFFLYIFFIAITLTGCAKRGGITGGAKDTIPPILVGSSPRNMSTEFKGREIRIDFNEYIKVKDINKQMIISPPMKYQPEIIPMGSASRFISIKIKDTLQENTTYSFNFGQSITDNNEGNPYSQFKFIFSTGTYIDSLSLKGGIKDAYSREADNFVTVMLYEANETFNDSTIYKERPRYVTNTLDSMVNFSLENLKEGRYHLIALKDKNNNYKFDPKADKIAFLNETVSVPDSVVAGYQLELFQETPAFKAVRPSQASSNRLYAGYEGDPKDMRVKVRNGAGIDDIASVITKFQGKDSLNVWLPRGIVADSLKVQVSHRDSIKDFNVKFKEMKAADSLKVEAVQKGGIHFREKFMLKPSTPLVAVDTTRIRLTNKDSVQVPYTYVYNDFLQELEFDFTKEESQKYTFMFLPGAMTDFYNTPSDSLKYSLSTRTYSEYGNMRVRLEGVNRFPLILELTNAKGEVKETYYSEGETQINFDAILPDKYHLRVIYDDNKNREWDTGSYRDKRQPEEVIWFTNGRDDLIDVRQNWDVEQSFNLGG
ncbi:Ig-like domain-containing protein [uncultured Flavobacterium sp.]|uniref:Ig-like domain-containing protein n=1 Tax=uncultured Flavobacterium sp. TaxID=165435 RepID=UPI0025FB4A32|nr:Ig-like domain-containing protein [uncultured Flavobacterium sp.]